MKTVIKDVLQLSGELAKKDIDNNLIDLTDFGDRLSQSNDIEFLWVANKASNTATKATNYIKIYSENKIAENVASQGSIRLGNEVFTYSKSAVWKTNNPTVLIRWLVTESSDKESLIEDIVALVGKNFIPKLLGLDAVAKKRGKDPKVIRDTFLYKKWKDQPDLKTINTESKNAPRWVNKLSHGERKK